MYYSRENMIPCLCAALVGLCHKGGAHCISLVAGLDDLQPQADGSWLIGNQFLHCGGRVRSQTAICRNPTKHCKSASDMRDRATGRTRMGCRQRGACAVYCAVCVMRMCRYYCKARSPLWSVVQIRESMHSQRFSTFSISIDFKLNRFLVTCYTDMVDKVPLMFDIIADDFKTGTKMFRRLRSDGLSIGLYALPSRHYGNGINDIDDFWWTKCLPLLTLGATICDAPTPLAYS